MGGIIALDSARKRGLKYLPVVFMLFSFNALSQVSKYTISGYVKEAGSNEFLSYANIYIPEIENGLISNDYGFYSLSLPEGTYTLLFSFLGYEAERKSITLDRDVRMDVELTLTSKTLRAVSVVADKTRDEVQMSVVKMVPQRIKELPAIGGEKDVLKAFQLMPGVQTGNEGQSGLYVRGGNAGQNMILLDESPVYNAQHLFGFISLFNGDAIKSADLTKGGQPARYGGRTSSILDMKMKEGDMNHYKGSVNIGLISANGTIEGPIQRDKSSFFISARKTYAEPIMKLISAEGENMSYGFYDLTSKLNFSLGKNDKLYLGGYFGNDALKLKDKFFGTEFIFGWGNATGTARWNHLFGRKLFMNTSLMYSNYNMGLNYSEKFNGSDFSFNYSSSIDDYALKIDLNYYPAINHNVKFGTINTSHHFLPRMLEVEDKIVPASNKSLKEQVRAIEGALYAEDNFKLGRFLKGNIGLRYSYFREAAKFYTGFEPRASVLLSMSENTSIKASYSKMNQYIHLLSGTGVGFPTDIWVPATDQIKPQSSWQGALGMVHQIKSTGLDFTLEGYYKKMDNLIAFKEGSSFFSLNNATGNQTTNADWQNLVTLGNGWSYGAELLVNCRRERFSGWISYTLSWTKLQFDELNNGEDFWADYDRRHNLSLVGIFKLNDRITLSANWIFKTGNAATLPMSSFDPNAHNLQSQDQFTQWIGNTSYTFSNLLMPNYGGKNQFRAEAYHRLDVNAQFKKEKKRGIRIWEIGLYNAYSRANPYYYYISRADNQVRLKRKSLFPVVPNVSFKFVFK